MSKTIEQRLADHAAWLARGMDGDGRLVEHGDALRGADLRGTDLSLADLRGADLRGAKLYRANLYGAQMGQSNLAGAEMSGVDLSCAIGIVSGGPAGRDSLPFVAVDHGDRIMVHYGSRWETAYSMIAAADAGYICTQWQRDACVAIIMALVATLEAQQ